MLCDLVCDAPIVVRFARGMDGYYGVFRCCSRVTKARADERVIAANTMNSSV